MILTLHPRSSCFKQCWVRPYLSPPILIWACLREPRWPGSIGHRQRSPFQCRMLTHQGRNQIERAPAAEGDDARVCANCAPVCTWSTSELQVELRALSSIAWAQVQDTQAWAATCSHVNSGLWYRLMSATVCPLGLAAHEVRSPKCTLDIGATMCTQPSPASMYLCAHLAPVSLKSLFGSQRPSALFCGVCNSRF